MKEMHIQSISNCRYKNECKYGPGKCWFTHKEDIEIAYEDAKKEKKINSKILNSTLKRVS